MEKSYDPILAIQGGKPSVEYPPPRPVRWGAREREQLSRMIDQPSLFYWNGPQTDLLVERFREHYPLKYVMPCSSGTAALHIAMIACGVAPGDEVITSSITDMGTLTGILYQQAVPVFADLEGDTYNLDPDDVERKITSKTRVILAVHLAGNPCAMTRLRRIANEHKLVLVEDCAQAWGARYRGEPVGTLGDVACFSLNDFKHIGSGDGGIVASKDPEIGSRLQLCGDKGYDRVRGTRAPDFLAPNYRISEPQSAVAASQMERLESIARRRRELGELLTREISGLDGIVPHRVDPENVCTYWFYMFRIEPERFSVDREGFVNALQAEGVPADAGYIPCPIYRYGVFRNHNFFSGQWPVKELGLTTMDYQKVYLEESEAILKTAVKLPINEAMSSDYVRAMGEAIRKVARSLRRNRDSEPPCQ